MISNPFPHPDKLGHAVAHFALTLGFGFGISALQGGYQNILLAWIFGLWVNTQVEIMDGTRPRRVLYGEWPQIFCCQEEYEEETIEGFSWKDWIAGIIGSSLAAWVLL